MFQISASQARTTLAVVALVGIVGLGSWAAHRKSVVPIPTQPGHFQLFTKSVGNTDIVIAPTDPLLLKTDLAIKPEDLAAAVHIAPAVAFHLESTSDTGVFRIASQEPLKSNTVYTISVDQGPLTLRPVSFAIQTKTPFGVVTSVPRDKATMVPVDSGVELTFNRSKLGSIDGRWGITPTIKANIEVNNSVVTVIPQEYFQYGTVYTLTVSKDFGPSDRSDDLDALKKDIILSFETQSNPEKPNSSSTDQPYYYVYPDRLLTEFDQQPPTFSVSLNPAALKREWGFALYHFEPEEFEKEWNASMHFNNRWSAYNLYNPGYRPPEAKRVSQFKTTFKTEEGRQYDARLIVPGSLPVGQYLLATTDSPGDQQFLWFQVTPLHTSVTAGEHRSFVWVKRFGESSSVKGATVRVARADVGTTNDQGLAVFSTPEAMTVSLDPQQQNKGSSDLVRIQAGSDVVYAPVDDVRVGRNERMYSFVSSDRKLYLPTDELAFWGVANSPSGDIRVQDVTVSLTNQTFWGLEDWYGQYLGGDSGSSSPVYSSAKVTVSPTNTYKGTLSFTSIRPGYYSLQVKRGDDVITQKGIQIATFTKPSYHITATPAKDHLFVEEPNTIDIKAEFFSGEPVGGIELQYEGSIPQAVSGRLKLDEKGMGRITLTPRYNPGAEYYPSFAQLTFTPVRAEEAEITASTSFSVYGPTIALNVSQEGKDRTTTFHVKATSIDLSKAPETNYVGAPVAALPITATVLYEYDEQFILEQRLDPITKKTYPVYDYKHITKEVDKKILTTGTNGVVDYAWKATESIGSYTVTFQTKDHFARQVIDKEYISTWMFWGHGTPVPSINTNAIMTLIPRAPTYIRFSAENPNPNQSNGALYRFNDPIRLTALDERDQAVEGGKEQFLLYQMYGDGVQEVDVTDSAQWSGSFLPKHAPTLIIGGVYWGVNGFQDISSTSLYLNPEEKKLGLTLKFDKEHYRPSDTAHATVSVVDPQRRPASSNVQLSLVDESLYSLYGYDDDILNETYAGFVYSANTRNSHPYELRYALNENALGAERGGCFGYGSQVLAPGGRTIPIQDLNAGDRVLTRVSDTDSQLVEAVVAKNQPFTVDQILVINNRLRVTFNHVMFVSGQWKQIGKARIGDWLLGTDGNKEIITSIEQVSGHFDVFNPVLEDLHTYFVDGVYAHNAEKGGGLPNGVVRKNFKNTAFVESKDTDANGVAEFLIKLPDNLTGWRARAQAATSSMLLGSIIERITTNLPFFVSPLLNTTYLTGDTPIVKIRAANASGTSATNVQYVVKSETLHLDKTVEAGDEMEIGLGAMPAGEHHITVEAVTEGLRDAVERVVTVVDSYKKILKSKYQIVHNGKTTVEGNAKGLTQLVFADQSTAGLVSMLESLCYRNGNRAEWKMDPVLADGVLKSLILRGCEQTTAGIDLSQYQRESGAFSILPYSSDDLNLTVSMVSVLPETSYDALMAKRYLLDALVNGGSDRKQQIKALYGLSVFHAAILPALLEIGDRKDLDTEDRLMIALAFERLGALGEAGKIYREQIAPALHREETVASVEGASPDETALFTARSAILAVGLGENDHHALWGYVRTHDTQKILIDPEIIAYAKAFVATQGGGQSVESKLDVALGDRTIPMEFNSWNSQQKLEVTVDELKNLEFKNVQGSIGMFSYYEVPSITYDGPKNSKLLVSRRYLVNGKPSASARVGDTIDVELNYQIDPTTEDSGYTITDYLPSGFKAVTSPVDYNSYQVDRAYVGLTDILDQTVSLQVYKGDGKQQRLVYRVRAIQKGIFRADGANIRSDLHPSQYNFSGDDRMTIQ